MLELHRDEPSDKRELDLRGVEREELLTTEPTTDGRGILLPSSSRGTVGVPDAILVGNER